MARQTRSKSGKPGRAPFRMTQRHERFCANIVMGMAQKAAYIAAGFKGGWWGGPRALLVRPEVKDRIKTLSEVQRIRLNVTMQGLVLDFRRAQDLAIATDNAGAFVAATVAMAKLMGFMKAEDSREHEVAIIINRPLREPTKELELSPEEWV